MICLWRNAPRGVIFAHGAHFSFEITLLQAIMLTLLLVCAFFSTQVQKYLAWVL